VVLIASAQVAGGTIARWAFLLASIGTLLFVVVAWLLPKLMVGIRRVPTGEK
jgi:hypothetical protein